MARNEEKHFCNLNRLVLLKEKEGMAGQGRNIPIVAKSSISNTLDTPEDIQKWLPSIKRDIDFYLKKSQVTCYSDAHVEECREKVVKLEKEFKAFVRKIKQLSPSPLDVIPWTNRPYKRKKTSAIEETSIKEFKRIATPILDGEKNNSLCASNDDSVSPPRLYGQENNLPSVPKEDNVSQYDKVNWNLMDQPLIFSTATTKQEKLEEMSETNANLSISSIQTKSCDLENNSTNQNETVKKTAQIKMPLCSETVQYQKVDQTVHRIVNYDSSDDENS